MSDKQYPHRWQKGQSGNPNGRPVLKSRVLASSLRHMALMLNVSGDTPKENRDLAALQLWDAYLTGVFTLATGRRIEMDGDQYLNFVKWMHQHIDGKLADKTHEQEWSDQRDDIKALQQALLNLQVGPLEKTVQQLADEAKLREELEIGIEEVRRLELGSGEGEE